MESSRCSCQVLIKFSGQIFEKSSNIKFIDNPYSGRELFHADRRMEGRTDTRRQTDKQTDMTKLITAFL